MVRQSSLKDGFSAGNPIANVLVVIFGALVIGASIVLGFFAFIALSGIVLITAAVIGVRVWWFKRKLAKQGATPGAAPQKAPTGGVIEGEFQVVDKNREQE